MANPFEDEYDEQAAANQVVKEGLICSFCFEEFSQINQLKDHFEAVHIDSRAGPGAANNIGSQIKGLIGKAKKKILKEDGFEVVDEVSTSSDAVANSSQYYVIWRENQKIGQTRSHFEEFKQIRERRVERYVIETNKLLIRLDKLITDAPHEIEKRKQHEKHVVMWVSDSDVKLCPNCAKSFNLGRRRHHCRLCGGIMCHNCSLFLDFDYARKLVNPTNLEEDETSSSLPLASRETGLSASGRRGSTSSLMSIVNSTTGQQHVRVCHDCKVLLDRRNVQIEEQRAKPTICHFYDRMKCAMDDCDKLIPVYYKMCYSFSLGESNYSLKDAQDLRVKLMRMAETMDQVSRKILSLGVQDIPPPSSTRLQLQTKIRLAATQYLREHMIGLPSLPSQEELDKVQEERRLEIERKIKLEKQLALEEQARYSRRSSPNASRRLVPSTVRLESSSSTASFELVSPDNGWGPETSDHIQNKSSRSADVDPMLYQINQVRSYIKRAREDHRYDEVNMLETNLKELEIEYFVQQQGRNDKSTVNGDS